MQSSNSPFYRLKTELDDRRSCWDTPRVELVQGSSEYLSKTTGTGLRVFITDTLEQASVLHNSCNSTGMPLTL